MIDENKLAEMKAFAENCAADVLGVTIPKEQMASIAETAITLWEVVRAARRWTNASPGRDASQAETKLRDALDRVKEIQRNLG